MAITAAQDLIRQALLDLRVIQKNEPLPMDDAQDCLDKFNLMIDSWNAEALTSLGNQEQQLVYPAAGQLGAPAQGKAYQLTIGVGGDFNCQRPTDILRGWVLFNGGGQGSLLPQYWMTEGEFKAIRQKPSSSSYPIYAWYDPNSTLSPGVLGTINLWPYPNQALGQYTQVINFRGFLAAFASLTSSVTGLAPGYQEALEANLAARLAPMFGRAAVEALKEMVDPLSGRPLAAELKAALKRVNAKNKQAILLSDLPPGRGEVRASVLTNSIVGRG